MDRTIIVFERRPRWSPELQRQFSQENVVVRSCRSTVDVLSNLESIATYIVVLDLEAGISECLRFLERLVGTAPLVPVIAMASQRTAELEWPLRELGAMAVMVGSTDGEDLADLCRRV